MDQEAVFTLAEAHTKFAKQMNGRVWDLLGKSNRSPAENEEMVEAAYASKYHWRFAGSEVNQQRGEWLLARVFTVLSQAGPAVEHARRCLELTLAHGEQMMDFDVAFAYEGIARALALSGKTAEAKSFLDQAQSAGAKIADAEDKQIFDSDIDSGELYGLR